MPLGSITIFPSADPGLEGLPSRGKNRDEIKTRTEWLKSLVMVDPYAVAGRTKKVIFFICSKGIGMLCPYNRKGIKMKVITISITLSAIILLSSMGWGGEELWDSGMGPEQAMGKLDGMFNPQAGGGMDWVGSELEGEISEVEQIGKGPSAKRNHSAIYDAANQRMIVF